MSKGSRFFIEFSESGNNRNSGGRGRSIELIKRRNTKLLYRYYYYSKLMRVRYDDVLEKLAVEFDLTEYTISWLVGKHTEQLKEIAASAPTNRDIKKLFPFFDWSVKTAK